MQREEEDRRWARELEAKKQELQELEARIEDEARRREEQAREAEARRLREDEESRSLNSSRSRSRTPTRSSSGSVTVLKPRGSPQVWPLDPRPPPVWPRDAVSPMAVCGRSGGRSLRAQRAMARASRRFLAVDGLSQWVRGGATAFGGPVAGTVGAVVGGGRHCHSPRGPNTRPLGVCAGFGRGNGGVPCAVHALCARCAKSWPFSTTGSSVSSEDWKDVIEWLLQCTGR